MFKNQHKCIILHLTELVLISHTTKMNNNFKVFLDLTIVIKEKPLDKKCDIRNTISKTVKKSQEKMHQAHCGISW